MHGDIALLKDEESKILHISLSLGHENASSFIRASLVWRVTTRVSPFINRQIKTKQSMMCQHFIRAQVYTVFLLTFLYPVPQSNPHL